MTWTDLLRNEAARNDTRDFGDPGGELESARSGTIVAPLTDLGVISVVGEDSVSFLNNLLTNDIKNLNKDGACLAGLCTPKGRLLATLLVWHQEPGLRLAISADLLAATQKKLGMYVLRSKVKLADASQEELLVGLSGPQAGPALASLGIQMAADRRVGRFSGGSCIPLGGDRYLLALAAASAEDAWQRLKAIARPVGIDAWHWLEIVAGVPRISAATQEEFVPQMINYEQLGGLSFTKGCYPGQEIVARSQYLGKIKRHMYRTRSDVALNELTPGAALYSSVTGDQSCGTVVQVAPSPLGGVEALAVLPSDCFEAGDIHLLSRAGPALRFLPLPYDIAPKDKPAP